jgi:acetyl-CoA acetyltransferase
MITPARLEEHGLITGIGQSAVGRKLGRSGLDLTAEAAAEAIADAGLQPTDIDGVTCFPAARSTAGFNGDVALYQVSDALGLRPRWFAGLGESAVAAPLIEALTALATGLAEHVLCWRTVTEASAQGRQSRTSTIDTSQLESSDVFLNRFTPYGAISAVTWLALRANQHVEQFGLTRTQLAQIPIVFRENAARNPKAIFRELLTLEDYLNARVISTPFCLYDCDVPVDGSTAIIVSSADVVPEPSRAVRIEAVGTGARDGFRWDRVDGLSSSQRDSAQMLWSRSALRPADIDFGVLYDGFSFITLRWLEELGFCEVGEGGDFIAGGREIRAGGTLPLNPHGGQLSAGRTHGFGLVHEAVTQLRGEALERQLEPARTAVLGIGGGPLCAAFILQACG